MLPVCIRRRIPLALSCAVLGALLIASAARADQINLTMTGSTQMFTLGQLLAKQYTSTRPTLTIGVNPTNGQSAFSETCAEGTSQIGMRDIPIQGLELVSQCSDMINIPVAISSVAVVYNLPGNYFTRLLSDRFTPVHPVRLTPQAVADIYECNVKMWNDPEIAKLNPGVSLPAQRIRLYSSSEAAGSGFVLAQWLDTLVPSWHKTVGLSLQVAWPPCSTGVSSSGNMAQIVSQTPYAMGFAGFDYAISYHLQPAALQNTSGYFVTPSINGITLAATYAVHHGGMTVDFRSTFVAAKDPSSGDLPTYLRNKSLHSYDPSDFEFFVTHRNVSQYVNNSAQSRSIAQFLQWSVDSNGGQAYIGLIEFRRVGKDLVANRGFAPVPPELTSAIGQQVKSIK